MSNKRHLPSKTDMALWLVGGVAAAGVAPVLIRRKVRPHAEPLSPVVSIRFPTDDGVSLAGDLYAGGHQDLVVLVHGFTASKNLPEIVRVAEGLRSDFDVLAIDMRGHGESGGIYNLGIDGPVNDVAQAVRLGISLHYRKVAVVGFSLGAASSVIAAAEHDHVSALVLVACPAAPLTGVKWQRFAVPGWRAWARMMGTRVATGGTWSRFPMDVADRLDTPLLVVHCGNDGLIPLEMSERLFETARCPKEFLLLPGIPHAELGSEGLEKVRDWLTRQLADPKSLSEESVV